MAMSNLFGERDIFEEDRALLKERWAQDGSTLVNDANSISTETTMYTVTSGKTLYMKFLVINAANSQEVTVQIKDSSTVKFEINFPDHTGGEAEATMQFTFDVPLQFNTDVNVDVNPDDGFKINFTGWEE